MRGWGCAQVCVDVSPSLWAVHDGPRDSGGLSPQLGRHSMLGSRTPETWGSREHVPFQKIIDIWTPPVMELGLETDLTGQG